jgi:DNA uptake protein ComE-like DNA-binding protein
MNKTTNRFIKVKPHMKLIDAEGKRKSITSDKLFSQLFPNTSKFKKDTENGKININMAPRINVHFA